jgi:hypothetical protein
MVLARRSAHLEGNTLEVFHTAVNPVTKSDIGLESSYNWLDDSSLSFKKSEHEANSRLEVPRSQWFLVLDIINYCVVERV